MTRSVRARRAGALSAAVPLAVCACAGALLGACAAMAPMPAWEQPPPPLRDGPVVRNGSLHRAELENGLGVLVLEDRRFPRVSLAVSIPRGESSVDLERAGLAPFTAELMERGSGDLDALGIAQALEVLGAGWGVSADYDTMSVQVWGLSRDLDRLFELLAMVVLEPRLEDAEAEKARAQTLAQLERAKDDPGTLVAWHTARALYDGHRFGLPVSGTPDTVAGLDAAAARDFHRRVFLPNGAVLSATGDVDTETVLAHARALFGGWADGTLAEPAPPPPQRVPPERRVVIVDRPDLVQASIGIAHEGIARTDPERIAASLVNSVLGGSGFSSRLMQVVRSEEGLVYGVGSGFALRRVPGPFSVGTSTRVAETRRVVDLVLAELQRMRDEPPSEDELAQARTLAVGSFALGLETADAVMASLVDLAMYGLPDDSLDTYRGRVRAVGVDEAARVARALLHPDRAAIVVAGPAEELRRQLQGLGPVEVVTP